jgi:hypothetical protein
VPAAKADTARTQARFGAKIRATGKNHKLITAEDGMGTGNVGWDVEVEVLIADSYRRGRARSKTLLQEHVDSASWHLGCALDIQHLL